MSIAMAFRCGLVLYVWGVKRQCSLLSPYNSNSALEYLHWLRVKRNSRTSPKFQLFIFVHYTYRYFSK